MKELIEECKSGAVRGMEHFLKVFSFVPDDKLDWAPFPTAKSAMQIAAHTAVYAGVFANMLRERKLPAGDEIPAFLAQVGAAERAITNRAEIEPLFRKNTDEVLAALESIKPEEVATSLDTTLGLVVPMTMLMTLPGTHAMSHAAQLDYLQTCWGDQVVHF